MLVLWRRNAHNLVVSQTLRKLVEFSLDKLGF